MNATVWKWAWCLHCYLADQWHGREYGKGRCHSKTVSISPEWAEEGIQSWLTDHDRYSAVTNSQWYWNTVVTPSPLRVG